MLSIGLISYILAVPIFSYRIPATVFIRITSLILVFSAVLTCNCLSYYPVTYGGIGLFSGLFHVSTITLGFQLLLLVISYMLVFAWGPVPSVEDENTYVVPANVNVGNSPIERSVSINSNFVHVNTINEQSLIVLFSVLGGCLLISSYNLVSMYMAIELQSFAAYIMCTLYRNSQSATSAGLKYFLLGSLASGIIALGTAVIYSGTGVTSYDDLAALISVGNFDNFNSFVTISISGGLLLIGIGYIFKVGAAPLYNWAPDVYDGIPTVITSWVSTVPKISILAFLLNLSFIATGYTFVWSNELQETVGNLYTLYAQPFQTLLLICSVISFIVGSILGLSQVRIKRLLTFSTITHVGFMLLALAISSEESIEGFVFYLVQYTITNVNTFLTLLAFGYITKGIMVRNNKANLREFTLLDDLKGQFFKNPLLAISFGFSLFSMAGIPPLVGFFAKQLVLYSVSYSYSYITIVAVLTSVISASYYLKIVQLMFFTKDSVNTVINNSNEHNQNYDNQPLVTTMHSSIIAILTLAMTFYMLDPSILLNACRLMSLSLFNI